MKIVLQQDVPNIGTRGDIKEVSKGHARNFLIPQKLAIPATDKALAEAKRWAEEAKKKEEETRSILENQAKEFQDITIEIATEAKADGTLFGTITPTEIIKEWQKAGLLIERSWIKNLKNIEKTGTHTIEFEMPYDIKTTTTIVVTKK